jgi:hypothetical protein
MKRKKYNDVLLESKIQKIIHQVLRESNLDDDFNDEIEENDDEFKYSDSQDLGMGRHRQIIIYKGAEIGYLITKEKNWLAPLEEIYLLPDVEYGMDVPFKFREKGMTFVNVKEPWNHNFPSPDVYENTGLIKGLKGWIDFKRFTNYDEALAYATQNLKKITFLFEYGDYD